MIDQSGFVQLPSVMIVKPMESARAKANADLSVVDLTDAQARTLVEQHLKKEIEGAGEKETQ